jgi:hypothetical protein
VEADRAGDPGGRRPDGADGRHRGPGAHAADRERDAGHGHGDGAGDLPDGAYGDRARPALPGAVPAVRGGTSTTAATPGTYTLSARIGTANTAPLIGATSGALTPVASATAAQWRCFGILYVRGGGHDGHGVRVVEFNHSGTTGGGGPVSATGNAIFGGVSAAVDFSAASALWIGVTHATSTTNTWTAQFVGWGSWN